MAGFSQKLLIQVRGIEVYYSTHPPELVDTYLAYAQQHNLLNGAGSDSYGPPGRMPMKYRAVLCRGLLECGSIWLTIAPEAYAHSL
jgi:hypothetical protein